MNRKPIAQLSLLLLPGLGLGGLGLMAPRAAGAEVLNRIVLRINDRVATLYDYEKRKAELVQEDNHRAQDPAERRRLIDQAGELVYKDMFDELLLLSRADQLGIDIPDAQVDSAIQQMREANGLKDDQQFAQALQQAAMTEPKLRQQIKTNLRAQEVIGREVRAKIKVNEEDLRRYYGKHPDEFRVPEQAQLREVVVPEDKVPSAAERARVAGEMRRAILAGKPMAEAAQPFHAQGEAAGPSDLGWVSRDDLDPALAAAVWKLPKGAVSEPVAGRGGLHVLQVLDRHEAHVKPFNEVSAAIQTKEEQRVFRDKLAEFMADLQKQSLVVAQPPQEAAGYRKLLSTGEQQPIPGLGAPETAKPAEAPGAVEVGIGSGNAPAPGSPGGLATPKPVDPTPAPVIAPPSQAPPTPPPPPPSS